MTGSEISKNLIYVLDLGLSKPYIDKSTGQHIPYRDDKLLTGTAKFVSINTHIGIEQSRRDDLEGLGYVILYFAQGDLPWHGIRADNKAERYNRIMECKIGTTVETLCHGLPLVFSRYMYYCRALKFDEAPDYTFLKDMFKEHFFKKEYDKGFDYDWNILHLTSDSNENLKRYNEKANREGRSFLPKVMESVINLRRLDSKKESRSMRRSKDDTELTIKQPLRVCEFMPQMVKLFRIKPEEEPGTESCNLKHEDIIEDLSFPSAVIGEFALITL